MKEETLEVSITGLYSLNEADAAKIKILKKQISAIRKQMREREKQIASNVKAMFAQPPNTKPEPVSLNNYGYSVVKDSE